MDGGGLEQPHRHLVALRVVAAAGELVGPVYLDPPPITA
jgi:hypothetical protein